MKSFFAVLLLCVCATGLLRAQDFNGTMAWSARIELTDPQAREQLSMAEEALKNPALLSMLLDNAQMRGLLEKQLGPINANSGATSVLPTGFTLQIKGPRALVKTEGGLVSREVLTLADKNTAYTLDRRARTYQRLTEPAAAARSTAKVKVTRTSETASLLGHACRRYLVDTDDGGAKSRFSVWTTTELNAANTAAFKRLQWGESGGADFLAQVEGVPLKIDATTPEAKIALLATRITPGALSDALFVLPAGFKETAAAGR